MTVILDNARFRKSPKTRKIIDAAGCFVLFLPPYSPNFNPIERRWFPLKNSARKILQTILDLPAVIHAAILSS